jgi:hypothetical protein
MFYPKDVSLVINLIYRSYNRGLTSTMWRRAVHLKPDVLEANKPFRDSDHVLSFRSLKKKEDSYIHNKDKILAQHLERLGLKVKQKKRSLIIDYGVL